VCAALAANCNLRNGGEFYGTAENKLFDTAEKSTTQNIQRMPTEVVLNIKGATRPNLQPDGSPEFVNKVWLIVCRLLGGKGRIDMFECARRDPNAPLEQTLGTLAELVREGKIGGSRSVRSVWIQLGKQ